MRKTILKTSGSLLLTLIIVCFSVVVSSAATTSIAQTGATSAVVTTAKNNSSTKPQIKSTENKNTGIKIAWNKVKGASKYRVFIKSGSKWKKLADTKSTYFTYKNAKNNKSYKFTIRCISSNGKKYTSSYDKAGYKTTYYTAPKLSKVENTTSGVKVTWKAVKGIDEYRVFVKRAGASSWTNKGKVSTTSYTHSTGVSGRKYTYTVRCVKNGKVCSSFDSKGKSITYVAAPQVEEIENTSKGVKLSWNKVKGASKYRVFIKDGSKWKKLADTKSTSYTYTGVKDNQTYKFTVRCLSSDSKYISTYVKSGFKSTYYSAPKLSKVENTTSGVKVTWKAVSGIDTYRLYVKASGANNWSKLADVGDTSYVHTDVESGSKYTYTVKCRKDNSSVSSFDSKGISTTYVATPVIKSATSSNNNVTLNWNAVNGADKYRVLVKSGSDWKKIGDTTSTKYTVKNIAVNKDLTYTIRCCDDDDNYTSDYNKTGYTVRVNYIVDQEAYNEENLLYEKRSRAICNKCGKDITDDIVDESSEYYGMGGYEYHSLVENCQSSWHGEYLWFVTNTNELVNEQQLSDLTNIYFYNETHKDQLEYRYYYYAYCCTNACEDNFILAETVVPEKSDAVLSDMESFLALHQAEHESRGERSDGIAGYQTQVYQIINHPEIGHYELIVK